MMRRVIYDSNPSKAVHKSMNENDEGWKWCLEPLAFYDVIWSSVCSSGYWVILTGAARILLLG